MYAGLLLKLGFSPIPVYLLLEGFLKRKQGDSCYPLMSISGELTSAEQAYSQIEMEALAVTLACKWLSLYVTGKRFTIFTDHKPSVSLLE